MKKSNLFLHLIPYAKDMCLGITFIFALTLSNMFTVSAKAENANLYFLSSYKKLKSGNFHGSIKDLNKLIESYPSYSKLYQAYSNRGFSKAKIGDYQGAILDYNKSIEINSENSYAYYNRGNLRGNYLGDFYGAIYDYNKVIEIDPNHTHLHQIINKRGSLKIKIGDKKGGCSDYKKSASLGGKVRKKWLNSKLGSWCRNM